MVYNLRWIQWGLIKVKDLWNFATNSLMSKDNLLQKLNTRNITPDVRSFGGDFYTISTVLQRVLFEIDKNETSLIETRSSLLEWYVIGKKFTGSSFFTIKD